MSLIHGTSMERWQEWRRSRNHGERARNAAGSVVRRARRRPAVTPSPGHRLLSRHGEGGSRVLIVLDPATPPARSALLTSLPYLHGAVDVLAPADVHLPEVTGEEWSDDPVDAPDATLQDRGITAVLSVGQHGPAAQRAHRWAHHHGVPGYVVQHSTLTPFAAPLPEETTVLAWSEADGDFWRSGRSDVTVRSIGSQPLWQTHHEQPSDGAELDERPLFLGRLDDITLPRRLTARSAYSFCRRHDALYRPHPEDDDPLSRATHELWRRRGIQFAPADTPWRELPHPVVAVRSVGVLDAAIRGVPAWVHAPNAPTWLDEFWDRYRMRRFGGAGPTPAPELPRAEPAAALAEILESGE